MVIRERASRDEATMQATLVHGPPSKPHPMTMTWASIAAALGVAGALGACTANADEVRPPSDQIFFPTGLAVAPNNSVAFVASANSELRYDSGAISVLELDTVRKTIDAWNANREVPGGTCSDESCCEPDPDHRETLTCDESLFLRPGAGVRIGNFATDLAIQGLDSPGLRVFAPTRGDPSIAWADWDDTQLSCSSSTDFGLCDDAHRLSNVHNDADLPSIPDEPYGVFADTAGEFAMVTHLTSGAVTLIDSPRSGTVQVADVLTGVFAADPTNGQRGATAVAGRTPNAQGDIVYVGSRSENRIQTFTVG